jgi:very-short-patch-repair endonuclease
VLETPSDDDRRAVHSRVQQRAAVARLATEQHGVLSIAQLYEAGLTRAEVRAQVRAGRWRRAGSRAVVTFTGPLALPARHWVAVIEGGPRAALDGASALQAAGLTGFTIERIRVTVPPGARVRHRGSSLDVRQSRRWSPADVQPGSRPTRTRTPVAAVRAGLWAVSDRQAALVVTMAVQQRLLTAEQLADELLRVRRDKRRLLLHDVVLDLLGGVQSLGELDVLRGCRERGLPEPDAQVLRSTPRGTYHLDFRWGRWRVVLEVDGIQHAWAQQVVGDALRHNTIALSGDVVLRLPLLGLRVDPDAFFEQLRDALTGNGWAPGLAA